MPYYLIGYDLNNPTAQRSQQIANLIDTGFGDPKSLNTGGIPCTCIISTSSTRQQIKTMLESAFEKGDKFVVVELGSKSEGFLKGKTAKAVG